MILLITLEVHEHKGNETRGTVTNDESILRHHHRMLLDTVG